VRIFPTINLLRILCKIGYEVLAYNLDALLVYLDL
jgi:hypothetical protein